MHKSRSVMTCAKVTLQSYMVHELRSLGPEILSKFKTATWKQMHSFYPRCYFASLRMNCCGLQISPIFDLVSDAPYAYQLPTSFRGLSQQKREKSLSRAFAMQARCTFCISYIQFFPGPFIGQKKRCSTAALTAARSHSSVAEPSRCRTIFGYCNLTPCLEVSEAWQSETLCATTLNAKKTPVSWRFSFIQHLLYNWYIDLQKLWSKSQE